MSWSSSTVTDAWLSGSNFNGVRNVNWLVPKPIGRQVRIIALTCLITLTESELNNQGSITGAVLEDPSPAGSLWMNETQLGLLPERLFGKAKDGLNLTWKPINVVDQSFRQPGFDNIKDSQILAFSAENLAVGASFNVNLRILYQFTHNSQSFASIVYKPDVFMWQNIQQYLKSYPGITKNADHIAYMRRFLAIVNKYGPYVLKASGALAALLLV
jgi:hypothetical protein